jgi:hypothetical protein
MKVLIIPLTILVGILIVAGIILNNSSPISIPSSNNNSQARVTGAVWKSIDGGRTFDPISKVNGDNKINLSRNAIDLKVLIGEKVGILYLIHQLLGIHLQ